MKNNPVIYIIVSIISVLATLIGKPAIEAKFRESQAPVLVKEIDKPDFSGLPNDLQKQITVLPIRYTLENKTGGTARNVTVFINSSASVTLPEVKFNAVSEPYNITQTNPNSLRIEVPAIRPAGTISFDLLAAPDSKVEFKELAAEGKIESKESFASQEKKFTIFTIGAIAGVLILWLSLLIVAIFAFVKIGARWRQMEGTDTGINRNQLIGLFIIATVYNMVVDSTGPFGAFLPLPHIYFTNLFYTFLLYLLITRYKLIEAILQNIAARNRA
jgi:hypothetical protein